MGLQVSLEQGYAASTSGTTPFVAVDIEMAMNSVLAYDITIFAASSILDVAMWRIAGRARRVGSADAELIGATENVVPVHQDAGALTWVAAPGVSVANFQVLVTGEADVSVYWFVNGSIDGFVVPA